MVWSISQKTEAAQVFDMALKKLHPRSGYGKIIDDKDGFTVFTVICQDDSQIERALDDYLNDEREKVRATNIDSLIDTSRKRKKKDE